jgi:hypothetical protein
MRLRALNERVASPHPVTLFMGAKFTSQLSQNALLAALLVTAGTRSDASIGLSAFFVATLVPSLFLGPLGGSIVDRLGPGLAYAVGAVGRAVAILPAFFLLGSPHMVWVVAALYSSASQVFTPAEFALVRDVQGTRPGRIYSGLTVMQYAGQGAGILIFAPLLFFFGGQPGVFLGAICALMVTSMLGSTLMVMGLGKVRPEGAPTELEGYRAVANFLFSNSSAFHAMVALTLSGIISRVFVVSLPGYVRDEINIGPLGMLFIAVPGVLGIITGLAWTTRTLSLENSGRMLRISTSALLFTLFIAAFMDHGVTYAAQNSHVSPLQNFEAWANTTAGTIIPAAFAGGFGMCVVVMSARFVLAELSPAGCHGRVYAVQGAISETILILPIMFAGVATAFAGTRLVLGVVGALALGMVLATEWRRASGRLADAPGFPAATGASPAAVE